MRKICLIGLILISKIAFSQQLTSFQLTKNGVSPIVVSVDSLDAAKLYQRTMHWVQEYYKENNNAIRMDVPNQKLQVGGIKKNAWQYTSSDLSIQYDVEYILMIDFEDNRMKLAIELGKTWDHTQGKDANSYFIDYRKIWKENGEVHKIYKEAKPGIDQMMNGLSYSLIDYLKDYSEPEVQNKGEKSRILSKIKF